MARRTHSRFIRPAPRTKMWIGAGVGATAITGSTVHLVGTLSAGALLLRPFTILRTIMVLEYNTDTLSVAEHPWGTFAKIIVTETAAALGITAIPDPDPTAGDPEAAWFSVQNVSNPFKFSTAVAWQGGSFGRQYLMDQRAMRKVGPDDQVATVFSQQATVGADLLSQARDPHGPAVHPRAEASARG